MSLSRTTNPVNAILAERPYLRWSLVPLAAHLCTEGYSDGARNRVIDGVIAGLSLDDLVGIGWLEPADLEESRKALRQGQQRAWTRTLAPICGAGVDPGPDVDGDRWGLGPGGEFPRELTPLERHKLAESDCARRCRGGE